MTVWILILTHTVQLVGVPIIANTQFFLFESQAACAQARPAVAAHAMDLAPHGYATPLAFSLTECLPQSTVAPDALRQSLELRRKPPGQE